MLCFNDKYIGIIFVIFWDFKKVYVIYLGKNCFSIFVI